ncbi:LacI family DNA-binding transcriptional regulator [Pseudoclavibacter terrae]|uniref:LacI family DNA-binding transcriptional regulator n=1 Tax=Pseudoclavibacter terrae TaxID=1530195 RepID=UPI00232C0D19|nr:LacI family DNA-binding transcriptional regulator [Pseudoclavibacter terrae]
MAAEAGVSTATVSRVLTGSKNVADETARRVHAAAEKLQYSGNSIAKALRQNSTGNVGMLVPSISNPFFTALVEQVEHQLAQSELNLFLCDSQGSVDIEAVRLRSLTQGSVDGILVSPVDESLSAPALQRASTITPMVQIDRRVGALSADWVGLDDEHAMRTVAEHLFARGVRSAAFVTSTKGSSSALDRLKSILAECARLGIHMPDDLVLDGDFSLEWGAQAADALLASARELPDAIICSDDLIAMGLSSRLAGSQVRVPDDVLVTGFDDIDFASLTAPPLTTLRQPIEQIAAEAVRLLRESIQSTERAKTSLALQGSLVARASTSRLIPR